MNRWVRLLTIISFASVTLSTRVFAGPENPSEWTLETLGFESFATHGAFPKLRLPLQAHGAGGFEILSWEKAPSNDSLRLLKYTAGEVGTSERVLVVRGMVVDPARARVLSDEVLAYQDAEDSSKLQGPQPKWSWTTGNLIIHRTHRKVPLHVRLK
jgi:hypothetical protein